MIMIHQGWRWLPPGAPALLSHVGLGLNDMQEVRDPGDLNQAGRCHNLTFLPLPFALPLPLPWLPLAVGTGLSLQLNRSSGFRQGCKTDGRNPSH